MAYEDKPKKDFKSKELLVIDESAPNAKYPWKMRVIQWIVDGKATAPKLELRKMFKHEESGEIRSTKELKGFGIKEFEKMLDRKDEILLALRGDMPGETATDPIDEVPF